MVKDFFFYLADYFLHNFINITIYQKHFVEKKHRYARNLKVKISGSIY